MEIRHIGITVHDIDLMCRFYRDILEFNDPCSLTHEPDVWIHKLTGIDHAMLATLKLRNGRNTIELLHYANSELAPEHDLHREIYRGGISHIALTVDQLSTLVNHLKTYTYVQFLGEIQENDNVYVVFLRDPEGNILELVEEK